MGFDINIQMVLQMCNQTGKPYSYGKDCERVYELPAIEVPESLRKYLVGRGHIFHAYTETFNEKDVFETSVEMFLAEYPSWDEVTEDEEYSEGTLDFWDEDDHNGFKKLLEWCGKQEYMFRVSWSY